MYTVMLADDEENVINVLKNSIAWQELGVDTLLSASDGQEALDFLKKSLLICWLRISVCLVWTGWS